MATPTSKATFKSYCKRALGFGVIDINVSDDQVDDRVDEALQYFSQYHYDGVERMYLKYQITQDDIDRSVTNSTTTATDKLDSTITASFSEGKNFIPMPDSVLSVIQIFPFSNAQTNKQLDLLEHVLVGEVPIRFNQHQNRLYLDMDFDEAITAGEYLIIECYRKLDPDSYTDIYNDMYLKRYATALIKRQWGSNLSKFDGVTMLGGVTMNGEQIYSQATEEIEKLEQAIRDGAFETPIWGMIG